MSDAISGVKIPRLPLVLGLAAAALGLSGLVRGPLGFALLFAVTFGLLLCLRAVVRIRAKRQADETHG